MKKLMFIASAMLCGAALAAGPLATPLTSGVVGYNTLMHNDEGTRSPLFGLCFTPTSGETVALGNFVPVNGTMTTDDDNIQVINPTSLAASELFTYLDKTTADAVAIEEGGEAGDLDDQIGWWDATIGVFEDDAKVDDYAVTPGIGFMGYFEAGNEISFVSSGEAPTVATSFTPNDDGTDDNNGTRSPILINYIPRDFILSYLAPIDGMMTTDDDNIQVINPTSLAASELFTYLDKTTADAVAIEEGGEAGDLDEFIGWWDATIGVFEDDAKVDDYMLTAGAGFMGYFEAGNEITFQLPSSTTVLD